MKAFTESALHFTCQGSTLLGILARPAPGRVMHDTSVLVVVGGPQYRAGAHRQFVKLARSLAAAGHAVLRFDVRGMGDSEGQACGFEAVSDDIGAAIGALQEHAPQARRIAMFGLCDGASAALLYLHDTNDDRVNALCLLNPWVRTPETLARTHVRHYYLRRLVSFDFWRKMLGGGVGKRALADFAGALRESRRSPQSAGTGVSGQGRQVHFRDAMQSALRSFPGPILLALSADDLTAKEFSDTTAADPRWRQLLARNGTQIVPLPSADHTLSSPDAQQAFETAMIAWLGGPTFPSART